LEGVKKLQKMGGPRFKWRGLMKVRDTKKTTKVWKDLWNGGRKKKGETRELARGKRGVRGDKKKKRERKAEKAQGQRGGVQR